MTNELKSSIRNKENRRRWSFSFKVLTLFLLEYLYYGETPLSPLIDRFPVLHDVLRALIFFLAASIIISIGRFLTVNIYLKKTVASKVLPNFVIGTNRISTILIFLSLLISLMLAFGIKPLEFLTSITIVAAAIAILTKEYISNIINGLIIMFSDQLEIGDKINIGKNTGFIRDITLMNTVLKSETGEIILIPNTLILMTDVVNFSKNNNHQVVFDAEVSYASELQGLEDRLAASLSEFSEIVQVEGAQLNVMERRSDSLLIRYQFPIKSGQKALELQARKRIDQVFFEWKNEQKQG